MITIGLLTNTLSSGNLGVVALGISNLLLIERACNKDGIKHRYVLFGGKKQVDRQLTIMRQVPELQDVELLIENALDYKHLAKTGKVFKSNIQRCDVVFDTSGGDSFSDIYGNNRIFHQMLPKKMAIKAGVPLILTPQTIGPFKSTVWKRLAKQILRRSELVFARDNISYKVLCDLVDERRIFEVTDMAMVLPVNRKALLDGTHEKFRVGLNVSGLLYHGGYTGNNQFQTTVDYQKLVHEMIEYFLSQRCEVHLIPHVIANGIESDNKVCEELIKEYGSVHYSGEFSDPMTAKGYISQMDLFLGSRMHSTIAAISTGVPVIPLSYSRKFEGLFSSIGYDYCVNLAQKDNKDVLTILKYDYEHISEIKTATEAAKEQIDKKTEKYLDKITELLKGIDDARSEP